VPAYCTVPVLPCRVSDPESNPDSIRSVDPDPNSESGSGSRRAKISCFDVLDVLFES
jgi:hypothetical protein